jgi:hypothetical protein
MNVGSSLSSLGEEKQNKKDDNECQFIIVFFRCIKIKQKKTTMSASSSSFSLNAYKQNKQR